MTSFHFTTAARRGVRRMWHDFVDEKFGLSSVNLGDEATFSGDIRCSSVGFLTLAEIRATHELAERSRAQVAKARHEHFVDCSAARRKTQDNAGRPRMRAQPEYVHAV